ncbi:flippase-like domain-containing protein [Deltaproteobacteria bacterium OttesenSCG-928-K17]|nr:flippase-like domain-containing protein [Deltaproteobacteria bacterium OttesenSCG-928-K17]
MPQSKPAGNKIFNIFGWALTLAGLVYALWGLDYHNLKLAMARYAYAPFSLAMVFLLSLACILVSGLRKKLMLGGSASLGLATKATVIGLGYNNILPAKAGEVIHVGYLAKRLDLPMSALIHLPLWERFADAHVLVFLAAWVFMVLGESLWPVAVAAGGLASLWLGLTFLLDRPQLMNRLVEKLPGRRLKNFAQGFYQAISRDFNIAWLARLLTGTVLIWLSSLALFIYAFIGLADLPLSFSQAAIAWVILQGSALLPSSPSSIGVFEAGAILALGLFNVPHAEALAVALVLHIFLFVIPVTGALIFRLEKNKPLPRP